jgi:glycosyltransferase involved in cell wall biosynthesis
MTICYFGLYNPNYSRNKILISGLKFNGVSIIECRTEMSGPIKYWDLIKKHWSIRQKYDIMIVGFPGFQAAVLAKFLTGKPIIFDAFYSIFDSLVEDRKIVGAKSARGKYLWLLDWLSCRLADRVLLDTNAQIGYFIKEFGLNSNKFIRVLVGSNDEIIFPLPREKKDHFLVHFHGSFIPLQGIEYIVEAAKILENENIRFNIIGHGQTYKKVTGWAQKLGIKNINFIKPVSYDALNDYLAQADVVLGIFGQTGKARRVIPNKVYEGLAAKRPVITGDSPAIRELLTDGRDVILCRLNDAQDLSAKIIELKNNRRLMEEVAEKGYQLFILKLTPKIIVENLLDIINRLFIYG